MTPERYQPGHRYQPKNMPPRIRVRTQALVQRCRPNAVRRNRILYMSLFDECSSPPVSSCGTALSPGIARCPETHAPRSIRRQRSLQNGRKRACSQSRSRLQVGHLMRPGLIRESLNASLSTTTQNERDVFLSLRRPAGEPIPGQKTHVATVVAAADLGIEPLRG